MWLSITHGTISCLSWHHNLPSMAPIIWARAHSVTFVFHMDGYNSPGLTSLSSEHPQMSGCSWKWKWIGYLSTWSFIASALLHNIRLHSSLSSLQLDMPIRMAIDCKLQLYDVKASALWRQSFSSMTWRLYACRCITQVIWLMLLLLLHKK